jgi:ferric-dicitrate binding protein FerR (iron transport regulator)
MEKKLPEDYEAEDFITDESFFNYHFKLNKEDELFWEEWITNNPFKNSLVEEAENTLQALSLTLSEDEYNVQFEKIKAAINVKKEKPSLFRFLSWNEKSNRRKKTRYLITVAVALLAVGYWFLHQPKQERPMSVMANNGNAPIEITLSDSTIVTLQPHSRLNYPATFDGKDRNVYLYGDAQFHVKRNEQHPFKVYAENVVATVLGTIFNVKQSSDSAIIVELLKGSLNVEIVNPDAVSTQSILLHPSERAIYMRQGKRLYGEQMQNHLEFNKNTFEEIAAQIKNDFGITVINKSNKKDWRFTGEFKNTTAQDIIESICLVKGLTYEVNGNTIVIK